MPTKEGRVTAAQAFREAAMVNGKLKKTLPESEKLIATVRKVSGSKTFDKKQLAWYMSQARAGKLGKGRVAKKSAAPRKAKQGPEEFN